MKAAGNPTLIALINGNRSLHMAECYTVTLATGQIYRYTSADRDLVVGGQTFLHGDVRIQRGKLSQEVGLTVASLTLTVFASASHLLNGVPWLQAVRFGYLDGARIQVERCFMPTWGDTSAGTVILFNGRVADAQPSRTQVAITLKSDVELLNIQMPRNVYQPGCQRTLFDAGCALVAASWAVSGAAQTGSTASALQTVLGQADSYFALGKVQMTSGALAGQWRTIQSHAAGVLSLVIPFSQAPAPGDGFTAYPGCDKQQPTCQTKFSNLAHFRGQPYVPVPETSQ